MKLRKLQISPIISILSFLCLFVFLYSGWAHALSMAILALLFVTLLFEYVLWHQPLFHGWLIRRPDLRGTWRVELQPGLVNHETKERVPVIVCYVGVKQTLSKLQMDLIAPDFKSQLSFHSVFDSTEKSGYQLIGVYSNELYQNLSYRRNKETHQSTILIQTHGSAQRPATMSGKYWTEHKTTDLMQFSSRVNKLFTGFEEAEREFLGISGSC